VLYADIAIVSSNALDEMARRGQDAERRRYIGALTLNLVLNGGWSWLFFKRRMLGTSTVAAALLACSSVDLTRRAVAAQGNRAAPLAVYAAWCTFATVLSGHIWFLNRR
jgi:tryptophan-rich sensory protein